MNKLSIIVPTYNEKENLENLVSKVFASLEGLDFELIIVDDNSPDGTGKLADQISSRYQKVKVVHREGKMGLGTAILDGIKVSEGDFVSVIDADLQHPPDLLRSMFVKAESGTDIVIASRYIEGGRIEGWSFVRRIISKGAIWLSHLLLKKTRNVKDTQSGYFIFRKNVIENVTLTTRGFKLLIEILVKGKYSTVAEIPYTFKPRLAGESKMKASEIIDYIKQLVTLSDFRAFKFGAVGVSGVFVNLGVLWLFVSAINLSGLLALAVAIEASILSNFLLNDFWTFKNRRSGRFLHRLIKCNVTALGALINYILSAILLYLGINYILADGVGILFGFAANYFFSEMVIWR
ncbi:MAG: glycosyltransferase family 2 protein [Nitrososphaeria archaeon]